MTFCDGQQGVGPPEGILYHYLPMNSSSSSGWCLDLGEKYTLRLTNYTLRQVGNNDKTFVQKFEVYGSLHGDGDWFLLSRQDRVDWRSQEFFHEKLTNKEISGKTKTWEVEGESKPCRYFKIVPMKGGNPSGRQKMSLAGVELYGNLSELELA